MSGTLHFGELVTTKSNPVILLIDMDGPLCHWVRDAILKYKLSYPHLAYKEEGEIDEFYMYNSWPTQPGCQEALRSVLTSPRFYHNLTPVEGSIAALREIQALAESTGLIEPFICSSPYMHSPEMDCHSGKAWWVEQNLGRWWTKRMILTQDKTLVRGHLLIDDKPNIEGAMKPVWQQLLFDCNWNRSSDLQRFTWADWPQLRDSIMASSETKST